jgi:hypothetical protein
MGDRLGTPGVAGTFFSLDIPIFQFLLATVHFQIDLDKAARATFINMPQKKN